MSKSAKKKGLGRGMAALLGDDRPIIEGDVVQAAADGSAEAPTEGRATLPLAYLEANPEQPRVYFDESLIDELAESIRDKGLLQPILVRPLGDNRYQIVAGERRWRACQKAGVHDVPVVIRDLSDDDALQIAIVENIQRKDLNAVEEAKGYQRLKDEFGHSADSIGELVGKSRSHVTNLMRLLQLPGGVQSMLVDGALSMGHARALIGFSDALPLAARIKAEGLSVRQVEALVNDGKSRKKREPRPGGRITGGKKDADTVALEKQLAAATGSKVSIDHGADGTGAITLSYSDVEQLDDLCARLGLGVD